MKNPLFSLVPLLLAVVLTTPAYAQNPVPGKESPSFALPDLDGKIQSLSDYRGKVVLVVFWATWCTSCIAEMPALNKLQDAFKEKGFSVLAVSLDERIDPVRNFLKSKGISFPVLMDSEKEASFDIYAVTALPAAFLISRNGIILEKIIGEQDWGGEKARRSIAAALAEKENRP